MDVDRLWHAFLHRFGLEHTFRMFKQTLGWTRPRLRDPEAADRWTWLTSQLTPNSASFGPWSRTSVVPGNGRLCRTDSPPARIRRGFRNLRGKCLLRAQIRQARARSAASWFQELHARSRARCRPSPQDRRTVRAPPLPSKRNEASDPTFFWAGFGHFPRSSCSAGDHSRARRVES